MLLSFYKMMVKDCADRTKLRCKGLPVAKHFMGFMKFHMQDFKFKLVDWDYSIDLDSEDLKDFFDHGLRGPQGVL